MAMNGNQLGEEIVAAIGFNGEEIYWKKIAEAIVQHIKNNAVVTTPQGSGTVE